MKRPIMQYFPADFFIMIKKFGWYGNFKTWQEAESLSTGYNVDNILNKVKESLEKVRNGEVFFERDSVIFDKIEYSWELVSILLLIASQNDGKLNLIDFGGSLGSTYYQNRYFLDRLKSIKWNIVEQNNFVEEGKKTFENEVLKFYSSIDECVKSETEIVNGILFSSVLQYLEKPYDLLQKVFMYRFPYIIVDRTGFTLNNEDRITVQKVPKKIYSASYPCWFFSENSFLKMFSDNGYSLIADFYSLDVANIPSKYKGFIFEINKNA